MVAIFSVVPDLWLGHAITWYKCFPWQDVVLRTRPTCMSVGQRSRLRIIDTKSLYLGHADFEITCSRYNIGQPSDCAKLKTWFCRILSHIFSQKICFCFFNISWKNLPKFGSSLWNPHSPQVDKFSLKNQTAVVDDRDPALYNNNKSY